MYTFEFLLCNVNFRYVDNSFKVQHITTTKKRITFISPTSILLQ